MRHHRFIAVALCACSLHCGEPWRAPPPAQSAPAGDTRSGDAQSGDTQSGDARSGDTQSGDMQSGDAPPRATRLLAAPALSGTHIAELRRRGKPLIRSFQQTLATSFTKSTDQTKVIGGKPYSELPEIGAILLDNDIHCTGTLIGKRTVLTAAHCLGPTYPLAKLTFFQGPEVPAEGGGVAFESQCIHKDFRDGITPSHDLATLYLASDLPASTVSVPAGALSEQDIKRLDLTFIGYGLTNPDDRNSAGRKNAVHLKARNIYDSTFTFGEPTRNTCSFDSGGPAIDPDRHVVGITSYGRDDCASDTVDSRVDVFLDWLGRVVNDDRARRVATACQ